MSALRRHLPLILYIWLIISLILPNIVLCITEDMSLLKACANVLLPMGVIASVALLSRKIGRTVWFMIPLMILGALQLVLIYLYGKSIIAVDMFLNIVTTNSAEVGELLSSLIWIIAVICLIYLPVLFMSVVVSSKKEMLSEKTLYWGRRYSMVTTSLGALALVVCYASPEAYAARVDLYPLNVGYNCYLAAERTHLTADYPRTSAQFRYDTQSQHPDNIGEVLVLVIGETSRAANWQLLGYDKATNPRLSTMKGELMVGKNVYSESNTTHKAVPMMLTPLTAENYDKDIYRTRSLLTAFGEAGWKTAFISNQDRNHSFIDYFADEADMTVYDSHAGGDFALLKHLHETLSQNNPKQLIVIHTYGSHFNYRDRYGKQQRKFLPDNYDKCDAGQRDKLMNAYDNSIVATDSFLADIINCLRKDKRVTSLLYCSDHGEDIYDNGRNFLHAGPIPSINQVHVAMFAWLSAEYKRFFPKETHNIAANINKQISSSRSYCPTAFGMAGLSSPFYAQLERQASLTSPEYNVVQRIYLTDHNKAVALSDIVRK